ncbi:MAG: hypothetical protein CFE23_00745 [Flavobacterium sp. BFFFF1]|uniref:glycosyltransferase n=1 Tax=Flavobacterium sp. BFFFF1 TaxID=2015557 RepID=UPI000BD124A9|nr:glycosyltransferase [Flavobacterium sp. BFFFF1]OYU82278.1 MAG: hypothetical protein CFE23_00745 [Flavobacterium sp. BFFFF1]
MKKLLILSPAFPKDESESHVIPFLQHVFLEFRAQYPEIELTVVAIHKPISKPYSFNGINVIPLNGNDVKYPGKLLFLTKAFSKIRRLHKKNNYDGILNLWYHELSFLTSWIHPKTFTWMLGQDVLKNNLTLRMFRPRPNKIMALSDYNNEMLFRNSRIKAHKVIPMAINESLFPELNTEIREIDVFGAGWLTPLKNYRLFVEVILELKKTFPYIKAEIAGTGPEETALKKFIHDNNLEDNVKFPGLLSHQQTLEKMNHSKVFLHPSTFEGGSTVYFESLFSGCQLVGTLPMMDKPIENFHCVRHKEDIVARMAALLQNPKPPKRITYYKMYEVCREIYDLYY